MLYLKKKYFESDKAKNHIIKCSIIPWNPTPPTILLIVIQLNLQTAIVVKTPQIKRVPATIPIPMGQINLEEGPGDPAAHSMTQKYCFRCNQSPVKNISIITTITMYDFNNFIFVKNCNYKCKYNRNLQYNTNLSKPSKLISYKWSLDLMNLSRSSKYSL